MSETPARALLPVRLAALWILLGALFKLFVGSPNDLPPMVRDFVLGPTLTFQLAIAIELSIALPALLLPRRVWALVALQLAVFCAILVPLMLSGAKSCGCFGSKVAVPPWVMLVTDGTLLALILFARPWRGERGGVRFLVPIAGALLFAWIAPFTLIDTGADAPPVRAGAGDVPRALPRYVDWDVESWIGKPIAETGLATLLDVTLYSPDATWVLYSPTCNHCADYLRRMGAEFASAPKLYVFVELPGDQGAETEVDVMPPGEHAVLPPQVAYVITPPWELTLAGGVVTAARHPDD
ncbi:MAG TPA: hypothetical protein VMT18_01940 [Planctomycetota bacterium]|nr:hypothetical protein [Planctomycetota bacterium]